MSSSENLNQASRTQKLTRTRIIIVLAVAIFADGLQLILFPFGWAGIDQVIDVIAMLLTMWIIGFHVLLLPTFVMELVPVLDNVPTWTACVIAVILLRKREQRTSPPEKPVIEI